MDTAMKVLYRRSRLHILYCLVFLSMFGVMMVEYDYYNGN